MGRSEGTETPSVYQLHLQEEIQKLEAENKTLRREVAKELTQEAEVFELMGQIVALKAMLTKHQWVIDGGDFFCPECRQEENHAPECKLAALLK